jgi:hypothetical protein
MNRFLIAVVILALSLSAVVAAQHVRINGVSIFQTITVVTQGLFGNGTVALPSIAYTAEPSSGWYRAGAGDVRMSVLGVDRLLVNTNGIVSLNTTDGQLLLSASQFGLHYSGRGFIGALANAQFVMQNEAGTAGFMLDGTTDSTAKLRGRAGTANTGNLDIGATISGYNGITTAGFGVPAIVASGNVVAATNVGSASIATFTPAAAGTFEVGCNVLVTTSTTHSFSCDVTYTDEGSSARTLVLPMSASAGGTFITTGLITNVTGVGPYASPVLNIRSAASTAITVRTSAGGTFTTVIYNARGTIKQVS